MSGFFDQQVRAQLAEAQRQLAEVQAERDLLRGMAERIPETHMQFGVISPDGAVEMQPCADWCWACKLDAAKARAEQAEADRGGAYRERAQLLAWLATNHPAVLAPAPDVDEPGWQILYLTAGGHQLSWHIHPRDAELYAHVEQVPADDPRAQWDGHTTAEKYQRIHALTTQEQHQ